MTSHDVVAKARRILGTKKIGHSGTLDPAVCGVLPLLVGNATRLSDYFMNAPKTYRCVLRLGYSTDTQDATGEKTASCDPGIFSTPAFHGRAFCERIEQTLGAFVREIVQIPPDYSSVKVGGRKLVDMARKGKQIEKKPERRVTVYALSIRSICDVTETELPEVEFDIVCSKGTYVRTICHDIGEILGTKAHMKSLVRLESGGFTLSEAIPLEELSAESVLGLSESAWRLAKTMPTIRLVLDDQARMRMKHGVKFDLMQHLAETTAGDADLCSGADVLVFEGDEFIGIGRKNVLTGVLELAKHMNIE